MKQLRFTSSFLCAAVLACGASGVRMLAQLPANATLYASGLEGPRGLAFGPDGTLYVAEAGLGGTTVGNCVQVIDRKSTRLNSSHYSRSRMPSSA